MLMSVAITAEPKIQTGSRHGFNEYCVKATLCRVNATDGPGSHKKMKKHEPVPRQKNET